MHTKSRSVLTNMGFPACVNGIIRSVYLVKKNYEDMCRMLQEVNRSLCTSVNLQSSYIVSGCFKMANDARVAWRCEAWFT